MAVSDDDLQRYGWKMSNAPDDEGVVTWVNPATGEVMDVPWASIPAGRTIRGIPTGRRSLGASCLKKLVKLPVPLEATAIMQAARFFPKPNLPPANCAGNGASACPGRL